MTCCHQLDEAAGYCTASVTRAVPIDRSEDARGACFTRGIVFTVISRGIAEARKARW